MKATLLFLGLILWHGTLVAENIVFDNRFADNGKGGIEGWLYNSAEEFKPFGFVKPAMKNGIPGVSLISQGKYTAIYLETQIPARAGDVFHLSAKIAGNGRYGIGFYQYGGKEKWQWCGEAVRYSNADSSTPVLISFAIPVSAGETQNVCPVLIADSGANVTFYDLIIKKDAK